METVSINIPHYDLSDYRYQRTQITTSTNKVISGQFVQFAVVNGIVESYPHVSHLCFLPSEHIKTFWDFFNANEGKFPEIPKYILQFQLSEISKIVIEPLPRKIS